MTLKASKLKRENIVSLSFGVFRVIEQSSQGVHSPFPGIDRVNLAQFLIQLLLHLPVYLLVCFQTNKQMLSGSSTWPDPKAIKNKKKERVNTLYNLCSVHRGMFSTSGDVQYIGGCSVHWGMFSTSGGVQYIGGYHEYTGGNIMSTSGDIMINIGDTMSTSGDVQYIEGYHEYIGGIS